MVLDVTYVVRDTLFRATVRRVEGRGDLMLRFDPALAPGARVREVSAGGRSVPFRTASVGRAEHVAFEVPLGEGVEVTVRHTAGWRLDLPGGVPERGERSRHLKILDARLQEGVFVVSVEGVAGARYELGVGRPGGRTTREVVVFPAEGGDPRDGYLRQALRFRP